MNERQVGRNKGEKVQSIIYTLEVLKKMLLLDTVRTELVYGETEGDVNKNCVGCRSFVILFRLYNDGTVRYNTGKSNKQFPALSIPFEENKKNT